MPTQRKITIVLGTIRKDHRRYWHVQFDNGRVATIRERTAIRLVDIYTQYIPVYLSALIQLPANDTRVQQYNGRKVRWVIWKGFEHNGPELVAADLVESCKSG